MTPSRGGLQRVGDVLLGGEGRVLAEAVEREAGAVGAGGRAVAVGR
jgi:hypothetical protein